MGLFCVTQIGVQADPALLAHIALTDADRHADGAPVRHTAWVILASLGVACTASKPPPTVTRETKEEELSKAWEPPPEEPSETQKLWLPPMVDRRAPFLQALEGAKRGVRADAEQAVQLSQALTGVERFNAYRELSKQVSLSEAQASEWYEACGPELLELCRGEASHALDKANHTKHADVAKREQCLSRSERAGRPDACLGSVGGDAVTRTRAALVAAIAERGEVRRVKLERVATTCVDKRCTRLRERALKLLSKDAVTQNDLDHAAQYALKAVKVVAENADASERLYARDADVDELCTKLDTRSGAGTCRKLERSLNGELTFRDFSKDSAGAGLDADIVRRVNAHYAPLVENCLTEQALRLAPPNNAERYEVRWVVINDGRVTGVELLKEAPSHPLGLCLKKQFELWRYPRYDGEFQHVEQAFTVTAAVRRTK